MNDESESDDYMDGLVNESPKRISFDYLCRLLDPKQSETPLWYKIIDRTAGILLFFQIDYESRKPTVSRCVRLTRENLSNLREFLEVAIFLNGRELSPSVVVSLLGRSYINTTEELTKVLDEFESVDLSELVEDDEDNTFDESSSRLQSDPAVRKLRAVLGEASTVQPALSKNVSNNHGDDSQSAQRKNDRRGLREPSPKQQVETDQTVIPELDIPDVALGLPQLSDDEDDRYSDRGSVGAPAHVGAETSITQESLKPLLFPVKRKQDETAVNAPPELNLGVVQALIPLPILSAASVLLDVEETCPEPSRNMSKANSEQIVPSETYYWSAPGENKVPLHPGFLIYVYRNILEDLKDQFGPGKRSHWSKYAHRLAVHLLGGWGKILKNDKCRNGFEAMLGSEFFKALAGHVHQLFSTEVTKEELLKRLDKTLKTCLERHTIRKPARPRPKPNPPSASPIVMLKAVPDKPVHPTTKRRSTSPVPCKVVHEKPTRSLRSPTKRIFSYDVEQDTHNSDRDPEYDPDHSSDDGSENSYEPVKSKVPRSAKKTHQTKRVAPPVAIHLDPEVRHSKEASAEPTEKTSTKRSRFVL
ncbi:hypothetical protein RvY_06957-2 [Ramazzottius varieornatus]|uniref:Uncharacterized protein n=1 Tax=Ramazzottius varieornatus TaxID=947166 RepID=A0A1D1V5M4_RAMVA|nr:hypothetical protein RvY_06957-2 [Ramazzottius varieornatus]